MRPRKLTIGPYATVDVDSVATSQTPAAGGIQELTLDGVFATAGLATLDFRRQVSIVSAADETARVFVITGTDQKGNELVEAVRGVNAGTALSERAFTTVTSIKVDADTAGAVSAGTVIIVSSNWLPLDYLQKDFKVGLLLNIPTGTLTPDFTVELTLTNLLDYQGDNPVPGRGQAVGSEFDRFMDFIVPVDHDTLANIAAAAITSGNIAFPVRAVRLTSNTVFTVNDVSLEVVQSHHGP